jgi:hypothetical protein
MSTQFWSSKYYQMSKWPHLALFASYFGLLTSLSANSSSAIGWEVWFRNNFAKRSDETRDRFHQRDRFVKRKNTPVFFSQSPWYVHPLCPKLARNAKLTDIKCYGLTYGLMWLLLVKLDAKKAGQLLRALQSWWTTSARKESVGCLVRTCSILGLILSLWWSAKTRQHHVNKRTCHMPRKKSSTKYKYSSHKCVSCQLFDRGFLRASFSIVFFFSFWLGNPRGKPYGVIFN